jgi:CheY-like chemotaxis protein
VIVPARLLHDLEVMLRRTLGDSIRLKVECPETIPPAYADATQLDSALLNLALNSRDAMLRGGAITISVSERRIDTESSRQSLRPGHYIVFSVIDTGTGMTPEMVARAVEPFYTTKGIGRGSGLGLSMVYGFVEQSGGHLHIDSRLGYGTRVDVYLPVAREKAPAEVPVSSGIRLGAGERVLIVEDEEAVRDIAAAFVKSLGYSVHAVDSAAAALDYLATDSHVALLFSDVMLGSGMNGKELAQAVRQQRPQLPVLLTSGYEDTAMSAADTQDFELLRKPYRREDLALALQRNLLAG